MPKKKNWFQKAADWTGVSEIPGTVSDLGRSVFGGGKDIVQAYRNLDRQVSRDYSATGIPDLINYYTPQVKGAYNASQVSQLPGATAEMLKYMASSVGGMVGPANPYPQAVNVGTTTAREGGTPARNYNIPYPGKKTTTVKSTSKSSTPSGAPLMPVPTSTATTPPVTQGSNAVDLMSLFKQLTTPHTFGSMNLDIPVINPIDMKPIYDKYSPITASIFDNYINSVAAAKPEIEARGQAQVQGMKDAWTASNAKADAANAASKQYIADLFTRLGREDQLTREGNVAMESKANELSQLAGMLQTSQENMQTGLNTARMGNYDTLQGMARQSKAAGLNDLLQAVMQGDIDQQILAMTGNAKMKEMGQTGNMDYQKLLAQLRGDEMDRGFQMWKYIADEEEKRKAVEEEERLKNVDELELKNKPFWDAYNELVGTNPQMAALFKQQNDLAGGSLSDTQKGLAALAYNPSTQLPAGVNSFTSAGGYANLGGGKVAKIQPESEMAKSLLQLFNMLNNFGGVPTSTQKSTLTGKA